MKIAICFSGLARSINLTIQSFKDNVLYDKNNEYHIFGHMWDNSNINVFKQYDPKNLVVEDFSNYSDIFNQRSLQFLIKREETNILNVISMWYKINKSIELVDESYDSIVRCRSDILFLDKINLNDLENKKINIPYFENRCYDFSYEMNNRNFQTILDLFAVGEYNLMKKYSSLFDNFEFLYQKGIVFHPETLLHYHLIEQDILINRFPMSIRIIREDEKINEVL